MGGAKTCFYLSINPRPRSNPRALARATPRLWPHLKTLLTHGPGTKARREALRKLVGYLEPRLSMMQYGEWIKQDLVIASGQVEGAVRHVVGERLDCAGMRWIQGKAEPLLHLRCIELNGDWEKFLHWVHARHQKRLQKRQRVKVLTNQPVKLHKAA